MEPDRVRELHEALPVAEGHSLSRSARNELHSVATEHGGDSTANIVSSPSNIARGNSQRVVRAEARGEIERCGLWEGF